MEKSILHNGKISIKGKNCYYELINYYDSNKPLIVFLHEGLGSIEQWKQFPELISSKTNLPVLIYDRIGHGKSDHLDETRTIDFFEYEANIVLPSILESLNINQKIILFGHSDGATIALLAAINIKQVIAVISEAAHFFREDCTLAGIRETVEMYKSGNLKKSLEKYHTEKTENMFYSWANLWQSDVFLNWDISKQLSKIKVPVLAIQGKDDKYATYAQLAAIKENCSNKTQIEFVSNCGHSPHFEQQSEVCKLTVDFCKEIIQ